MIVKMLAEFDSARKAQEVREIFAGELAARYDPVTEAYTYQRDGQTRRLVVLEHPERPRCWQVLIQVE